MDDEVNVESEETMWNQIASPICCQLREKVLMNWAAEHKIASESHTMVYRQRRQELQLRRLLAQMWISRVAEIEDVQAPYKLPVAPLCIKCSRGVWLSNSWCWIRTWVLNKSAIYLYHCTNTILGIYFAAYTYGHKFIKQQFNVTSRFGWQIEPVGHSALQTYILGLRPVTFFCNLELK
ncbi:galactose mutarotase-like domain-containing protein [Artemisia annua]|uniref:Galactose mutarotase-like domain-containing protein n=1 Tax=Artemisia annua TaxID=35608 RepID=A0A2U1KH66_ARTAN|nr:galactose mutarotase-like domain-containing protein [Artemisia annua]